MRQEYGHPSQGERVNFVRFSKRKSKITKKTWEFIQIVKICKISLEVGAGMW